MKWCIVCRKAPVSGASFWRESLDLAMVAGSYGEDVVVILVGDAALYYTDSGRLHSLQAELELYDISNICMDPVQMKVFMYSADRLLELD